MQRAALYVRQSIDNAEGIDRQLTRTRVLAENKGWTVVKTYTDNDVSAYKGRGRGTAWSQMLDDYRAGDFDVLVAVDIDRLLRSIRDIVTLTDLGVPVLTVNGDIDLTTADGKVRAGMLAVFAQFYSDNKGAQQKRANETRVASGKPVPGRRRYGYETGNMVPLEPEASVVRALFADFKAGASVRSLAMREGRRTGWVREILRNQSYAGKVMHKGVYSPSDKITALVSEADSLAVNAILDDPSRKTTPGATPRHLMSGVAICGVCGAHMLYMRAYRCAMNPAHPSIIKSYLDPLVRDEVYLWALAHITDAPDSSTPRLAALLIESAEASRKRAVIQELASMPGADLVKARKDLAEIGKTIDRIEADVTRERSRDVRAGALDLLNAFWLQGGQVEAEGDADQAALDKFAEYWSTLTLDAQRNIVRSLFVVEVNPGRVAEERVKVTWLEE